ncbi:hypothetical protein B0H14DRAFT_2584619 [Mycena olivaceomarginata]|nr:hypothetical protein B0H14DRAFT_2584619 [Mycena olivaceomarginata]
MRIAIRKVERVGFQKHSQDWCARVEREWGRSAVGDGENESGDGEKMGAKCQKTRRILIKDRVIAFQFAQMWSRRIPVVLSASLSSIIGSLYSISDTFIVSDGVVDGVLLDVIVLPGSKIGICFSDIPDGWDTSMIRNMDVFRTPGLLPRLGNDPALRDATYSHSRLNLMSPQAASSLRVLQYSADHRVSAFALSVQSQSNEAYGHRGGLRLMQSGNPTYHLHPLNAIESTFDDLQLKRRMSPQVVIQNIDGRGNIRRFVLPLFRVQLLPDSGISDGRNLLGVVARLPDDQRWSKQLLTSAHQEIPQCFEDVPIFLVRGQVILADTEIHKWEGGKQRVDGGVWG